jgi:hypothetical protein
MRVETVARLYWMADAYLIIKRGDVDWGRLLGQARKRGVTLSLAYSLRMVQEYLAPGIPGQVLTDLTSGSVSWRERVDFLVKTRGQVERGAPLKLLYHYRRYRQLRRLPKPPAAARNFVVFLGNVWGLDNPREVPGYMFNYGRRVIQARLKIASGSRPAPP